MKKIFLILSAAACYMTAQAQNIDQVYTSNGSVYEGYISEQIPGESVSVYAEKATIVIPSKDIISVSDCYRKFPSLSPLGQDWFKQTCDTSYVKLSTVHAKDCIYDDVIILSKDNKNLKIVAYSPRTYTLDWKDIVRTTKTSPSGKPYGVKDIVTLKTGERLVGTIVEQIVGESLSLMDENGEIHKFNVNDILSTRNEKISDDYTVWNQSVLLDRIEIDGKKTVEGFVVSRIMGKKLNILLKNDEFEEAYDLHEITKYQKYLNPDYIEYEEPVVDTIRYVKANKQVCTTSKPLNVAGINFIVDSISVKIKAGERFQVEIKNIDCTKYFSLYKLKKTKYKTKDASPYVGKSYDAFKNDDQPVYECPPVPDDKGVLLAEPVIRNKGVYFLIIEKTGKGLIIEAI
jgi:hypothetical protein